MQKLLRSLGVAFVCSFVTPALLFAAIDQKAASRVAARAAHGEQERAAGQKATAQRRAVLAEKRAIVQQMKGNSSPELRMQLIQKQMKGGN